MALPDYLRVADATSKTFKSSGGDATLTLTSVSNGAARQSAALDLGSTRPELQSVTASFEIAATPTAGNTIDLYWAPSTDNSVYPANVGTTDAAYSGYSSNLTAAIKQLQFIGSFICTAQATATVQKGFVGVFRPPTRYGVLVVVNNSGAALHSSATNMVVTFTPVAGVIEDT